MQPIPEDKLQAAFAGDKVEHLAYDGLDYERLSDSVGPVPRGSVRLPDGSVIPGYPAIGRIQTLATGLREQFATPVQAEEKIDGFNVRVVRHEGRLLAFSRGGFVCPFSVDRVPEMLPQSAFDEDPDLVLCCEIAGPENPYLEGSPPHVQEDVALFLFDMMYRNSGGFIALADKAQRIADHGLPGVRTWGPYAPDDVAALREVLRDLDAEGAEGVVLKTDADGGYRAKYVTAHSAIQDMGLTSHALLDLPPEFFTNRLLRMALFAAENGQRDDAALERELGQALLRGVFEASDSVADNGLVDHPFRCRFRSRDNAERFVELLRHTAGKHVRFPETELHTEGEFWILEFRRVRERMTSWLRHALGGGAQFD